MANKGTVAAYHGAYIRTIQGPRYRLNYGALSITGTAQKDEVAAATTVLVLNRRLQPIMAAQSKADGSLGIYNLAAGRYFLVVDGEQDFLPGIFAVDVS